MSLAYLEVIFIQNYGCEHESVVSPAMTMVIAKRKRREYLTDPKVSQGVEARSTQDSRLQTLLRQSFESKFEPLEACSPVSGQDSFLNDDFGSEHDPNEWTGFSEEDEEEEPDAVVVHYQNNRTARADISKQDLKSFMVCRT